MFSSQGCLPRNVLKKLKTPVMESKILEIDFPACLPIVSRVPSVSFRPLELLGFGELFSGAFPQAVWMKHCSYPYGMTGKLKAE